MPLDGHSYLVSQGWTGSGTGLRQGAITRPLAIPQKKTLAGLGKDRDEAFPFWDHLFSAASKSIQIKISGDDSDDSNSEPTARISLKRTSTGILSNRRPVTGDTADNSGATTPEVDDAFPRLSLLATAKRAAAKRVLYSRFFRGAILGPDSLFPPEPAVVDVPTVAVADVAEEKLRKKKRKLRDVEKEEKRERKRLKKEKKELKEKKQAEKLREKSRGKERKSKVPDAAASNPEINEKKRKRKREAEDDIEGIQESTRQPKQNAEKTSKEDKGRRKEEKQEVSETSQVQSGEERKRKRKRPV
ncbi:hypothetical protein B0H12DRAFT_1108669, partial [Mycena haematopus]